MSNNKNGGFIKIGRTLIGMDGNAIMTYAPTSAPTLNPTPLPTKTTSEVSNIDLALLQPHQGFVINGANAGDQLGYSVSNAGDVNGDGYDDIIIGAPYADSHKGKIYLIYGKEIGSVNINLINLSDSQGIEITYPNAFYAGYSVSGAGDINGDGYDDILFGIPQDIGPSCGSCYKGISYIIYGSNNLTNINLSSLSITQGIGLDGGGWSVSGAGDINKDGYSDIIISAPGQNSNNKVSNGIVYVVYGNPNLSNIALYSGLASEQGFVVRGVDTYDNIGYSVSYGGDINNDGFPDIIVGSKSYEYGLSYIIYGNYSETNIDLYTLGAARGFSLAPIGIGGDRSSRSVSSAGDINGDGYDDVIIGAYHYYTDNKGICSITYGASNLNSNTAQGFSVTGISNGDYTCWSVSGAGDVNGDSYDDVIIGAYGTNSAVGKSYIIFGKATNSENINLASLTSLQGFSIIGVNSGDKSGFSVSGGGDINGDGYSDYIIGAPGVNNNAGAVYVLYGNQYQTQFPTSTPSTHPTSMPSNPTSQPTTTLELGLVAYYPFNSNADDESGHGNNGVVHSAILVPDRFGVANSAYSFDGSSAYIVINNGSQFNFISDMSLSIWVKPSSIQTAYAGIFSKSHLYQIGWSVEQAGWDIHANLFYFSYKQSSDDSWGHATYLQLVDNQWNHLAFVKQGTTVAGYLNGNSITTQTTLSATIKDSSNLPLYVGADNTAAGPIRYYNGSLDDIRIYNRALAADEVQQLYTFNAPTPLPTQQPTYRPTMPIRTYTDVDLATLNNNQGIAIFGAATGDFTGYSVSSIGDFNGDGFDDVIIGAYKASPILRAYAGTSYVIFGHSSGFTDIDLFNLTPSQGFKIFGAANEDKSGYSVASAGDINGDGFADVIIGSYKKQTVYIVYGKANHSNIDLSNLSLTQGFAVSGGYSFGWSVAGSGDINGDGFADIIIGESQISSSIGKAYIIFGGNSTTNINNAEHTNLNQGFTIIGAAAGDAAGMYVSSAGDVNGDGLADIIVQAPYAASGDGISYVIFGKANCSNINLANLSSLQGFAIIGALIKGQYSTYTVNKAGDINGDGYAEIIIGAPYTPYDPACPKGMSYVIFGKQSNFTNINLTNLTISQGFSISGRCLSGWSVAGAGDINGDGFTDIIVGAPYESSTNGNSYIIFGKANGFNNIDLASFSTTQGFKITGATSSYSGFTVNIAGDFNGDGYSDIIIGAYAADYLNRKDAGAAYIIFDSSKSAPPSLVPTFSPTSPTIVPTFIPSVLTAAPTAKPSFTAKPTMPIRQIADVNLGQLNTNQAISIFGSIANEQVGTKVSFIGDFNGDGFADVVISGHKASPPVRSYADKIYVIFGSNTGLSNIDLLRLKSTQGFKILGNIKEPVSYDISEAGDVNGDGFDDIIIGAYLASPNGKTNAGTVYVVFGYNNTHRDIDLSAFSSTQGFKIFGETANDWCGWSVASAGDFNGDRLSDIIIGTRNGSPNGKINAGKTYIIFGKSYGFNNIDLADLTSNQGIKIIGAAAGDFCGYSVNRAGDVNGDEYSDIIIGAYGAYSTQPNGIINAGIAYIILGQKDGYTTIDLAYLSEAQGFKIFGNTNEEIVTVAEAGDINGDGFADIMIGAPYSGSEANLAYIYIIFGKFNGLANVNLASLTLAEGVKLTGSINSRVGFAVASIGDLNSDGYSDVIIGGYGVNSNVGASYVVFGKASGFTNMDLTTLNNINGFTISGINPADNAGWSVSGGDFNGDGYDDVIVGAPGVDPYDKTNAGAAYIILNSGATAFPTLAPTVVPTLVPTFVPTIVPTVIPTITPTSLPMVSPTTVPTSAPTLTPTLPPAYIDLANLQSFQGFKIYGAAAHDNSGQSVASAGDVNKDGYDDIIIGSPFADPNSRIDAGITYVIYGRTTPISIDLANLSNNEGFAVYGASANDRSGVSASSAGDINNDGFSDIIIGAYLADSIRADAGTSYVIYGKERPINIDLATLSNSDGFRIYGAAVEDFSGYSVALAGDVNHDGYSDIIVGARGADPNSRGDAGISYVIYGNTTISNTDIDLLNLGTRGFTIYGAAAGDESGESVASAGDVNNDGFDDVIIGARYADPNSRSNAGISYVIFGKATRTSSASQNIDLANIAIYDGFSIYGAAVGDASGKSVSTAGDINKDGFSDIIIGAPYADPSSKSIAGISYVIYGKATLNNVDLSILSSSDGFAIYGAAVEDYSGWSVASAGDINKDGFPDIIIGACFADPNSRSSPGISYVIYGKVTQTNIDLAFLSSSDGFAIYGAVTNDNSGWSVNAAGDINKDGFSDIIIGAPYTKSPIVEAGTSYVIYGSASGFITSASPTAAPTSSPTISLDLGLVAYYSFNGNANDATGHGNNGVVHLATLVADRFGNPNSAYSFDGSSSYIEVLDGTQFDFTNSFSISIWVKPDTTQSANNVFLSKSYLMGSEWGFEQSGNNLNVFKFLYMMAPTHTNWCVGNNIALSGNSWNNIIIIKNGAVINLYLNNGSPLSTSCSVASLTTNNNSSLYIGVGGYSGITDDNSSPGNLIRYFKGVLDDIRIYNRTLTADEVQQLYTYGAPTVAPTIAPTQTPTVVPTVVPSVLPTVSPSLEPTALPTVDPSAMPTYAPAPNLNLANLLAYQGISITGANNNDNTAGRVKYIGDINGDGKDDIIIGAHGYSSVTGRVYVVYGGSNLANINLASLGSSGIYITGINAGDEAGSSVSGAGDVNGDGYDDIIIGAPIYSSDKGTAYLIYGASNLNNINLASLSSNGVTFSYTGNCYCHIGVSVSSAGDVNGDGKDDFLIGANMYSASTGIAFLIYGSSSLPSSIDLASLGSRGIFITGTCGGCYIGTSVSGAGDVNGDGKDDFLIGAFGYSTQKGIAYLIYGSNALSNIDLSSLGSQGISIVGINDNDYTGFSVSRAGDVNSDGKDDVIIGAPHFSGQGNAYLIYGSNTLSNINLVSLGSSGVVFVGSNIGDRTGYSVSDAGDINRDGYDDIIIGAPFYLSEIGHVYVIYGSSSLANTINLAALTANQGFIITGPSTGCALGTSVSIAGDVNRDGKIDLILGAPSYVSNKGIAYLIYGATTGFVVAAPTTQPTPAAPAIDINVANLMPTQGISINGVVSDYAGWSVSNAGDVNGDGKDDIVIGALGYSSTKGRAYIIYGGNILSNIDLSNLGSNGISITGINNGDQVGYSVSIAGDVNGDGYDDIIIGAPTYLSGGTDQGIVYLIYGGNNLANIALSSLTTAQGFSITGVNNNDFTGYSVSGAGDVNGDGKDDFLIGSPHYSSQKGIVYLIYGSSSLSNINLASLGTNGITILGANNGDKTGFSVSSAGDVNGDGKDDVIIGAYPYNANTGIVYLIYGSSSLPNINLPTLNGNGMAINGISNGAQFGVSVSSAGDVNGDGKSDVIIGANRFSSDKGIVYLLYGGASLSSIDLANLGSNGITITGANAGDITGVKVSGAGDINCDGKDDIIIGAYGYSSNQGRAYVIYGANTLFNIDLANLNNKQGLIITSVAGSELGSSVSSAGDVNNDGKDDIIVGARGYSSNKGAAYIIYGAASGIVTSSPTISPTVVPSTALPTIVPTQIPTVVPTIAPTSLPTVIPTTAIPSVNPTATPSVVPTIIPTVLPTTTPTAVPTYAPAPNLNLANLVSYQGISITGENAGNYAGQSVSNAGDVNGDGKDDIIIGAPHYLSDTGKAYLIYGGTNLANINLASLGSSGISITGVNTGDHTGYSVSSAGDVNGDGYDDLIIGAFAYSSSTGRAYLIYGSSNLADINLASLGNSGITITGVGNGYTTGWSVSGAGDVNGDGKDDFIIGAVGGVGQAYLIYGATNLIDINLSSLGNKGITITGPGSTYETGSSVSSAGDVNGDGKDDFLIGAPGYLSSTGKVYLIYGATNLADITLSNLGNNGITLTGADTNHYTGKSVSNVGDVNGDGKDDLLIGAPYYASNTGKIYLIYGASNLADINLSNLGSNGITITGEGASYNTGWSVSGAGDINGDGKADLVIGAYGYSSNTGKIYLIYGSKNLVDINLANFVSSNGFSITGTSTAYATGISISNAGDVNGDGKDDLVIGAPHYSSTKGISYLIYGATTGFVMSAPTTQPTPATPAIDINLANLMPTQGATIVGANTGDYTGFSVSGAGDINGDGKDDFLISAHLYSSYTGKVYVLYGGNDLSSISLSSLTPTQGFSIIGEGNNYYTGRSSSGAGDVNGDGFDDIIISAPGYSSNKGKVYIILGKSSSTDINLASLGNGGITITGVNNGDSTGVSVASAGDVNGDGKSDVIIGANGYPSASYKGRAYIIYGKSSLTDIDLASLSASQGISITGANTGDHTGYSVSGAVDINGDGKDDVIIGAYEYSSATGIVYIIYGSGSLVDINLASLGSSGISIVGINPGDHTGYSVSGAGDINGDGKDDFLISAHQYSSGKGRVYVIYGSNSLSNINLASLGSSGITITGANNGVNAGISVSCAGDINRDGKADIIFAEFSTRKAYVVYGGSNLSNIILSSLTANQGFSISGIANGATSDLTVSGLGDINGDGKSDIIIGADGYLSHKGAAYIIYGAESGVVTSSPTATPTLVPTTALPTIIPTQVPSFIPTLLPTAPTFVPTVSPSSKPTTSLDFGLVAYYPFNGNANDATGHGNDGVVHSATLVADRFGNPNSAYSFDGISSYIEVVDGTQFDFANNMSVSLWSNPRSSPSGYAALIDKSAASSIGWDISSYWGTTYYFRCYPNCNGDAAAYLAHNIWTHLVITKQDTVIKVYLNGALDRSNDAASSAMGNNYNVDLIIGGKECCRYDGLIDDIRIYNRALTLDEVEQLYTYNAPTVAPTFVPTKTPTHSPTMLPRAYADVDLASLNINQGIMIAGAKDVDNAGFSVANAGDFNGDGYDDVIVGAPHADPFERNYAGASYLIFGSANPFVNIDLLNLTPSQGFSIFGETAGDESGYSVSSAGDFNKDGFADVIIGARFADAAADRTDAGRAYVIFGKSANHSNIDLANLTSSQGFKILGVQGYFGWSVSAAGDINGDSYSDIIVSAPQAGTNGRSKAGITYVVFGKANGFSNIDLATFNDTQGFRILGAASDDQSGISIHKIGDINHDGFDEFMVGAIGVDTESATDVGAGYVIFGKASGFTDIDLATMNETQGFRIIGYQANGGSSVSGAGDVNGDGFEDLIIGFMGEDHD